jgi:hypothetical protein
MPCAENPDQQEPLATRGEMMTKLASRDVVPKAKVFASLMNPNNSNAEPDTKDVQAAATVLGVELQVLTARNEAELEVAFAAMDQQRIGGLLIGLDGFGVGQKNLLPWRPVTLFPQCRLLVGLGRWPAA